jgi:hypothetical protein
VLPERSCGIRNKSSRAKTSGRKENKKSFINYSIYSLSFPRKRESSILAARATGFYVLHGVSIRNRPLFIETGLPGAVASVREK